jgi:hypothetical protein
MLLVIPGDFPDVMQLRPIFPSMLCHPKLEQLLMRPINKKQQIFVIARSTTDVPLYKTAI